MSLYADDSALKNTHRYLKPLFTAMSTNHKSSIDSGFSCKTKSVFYRIYVAPLLKMYIKYMFTVKVTPKMLNIFLNCIILKKYLRMNNFICKDDSLTQ